MERVTIVQRESQNGFVDWVVRVNGYNSVVGELKSVLPQLDKCDNIIRELSRLCCGLLHLTALRKQTAPSKI